MRLTDNTKRWIRFAGLATGLLAVVAGWLFGVDIEIQMRTMGALSAIGLVALIVWLSWIWTK